MTQLVTTPTSTPAPDVDSHGAGRVRLDPWWTVGLVALSVALVGLSWGLGWRGGDVPADLFRVEQFRAHGFALWDSQWYSGNWAASYSLLYPALGAAVGVGALAMLSAAVATAAFDRILVAALGPAGRLGSAIFAVGVIVETSIGQLAFFTGMAFGLACVWVLLCGSGSGGGRRPWSSSLFAGVLALASTATSPLAGAFLALALAAWFLATVSRRPVSRRPGPRRPAWRLAAIGVVALLPIVVTSVLFPGQGSEPYPVIDWVWESVIALIVWAVAPRRLRALRIGIGLYLLMMLGAVSVPSALGGNVGRLEDVALPIVAACAWARRDAASTAWPLGRWLSGRVGSVGVTRGFRVALVGVAVPLVLSQWGPAWPALSGGGGARWTHRAYYAPLDRWLAGELEVGGAPAARVEVVPTADHWEADFVAASVPLARGWDRQLDEADDPLFYGGAPLDAETYVAWLKDQGVRYVALADAPLDMGGTAEARLLTTGAGVPGLRLVWRSADWRVWQVVGGPGLVSGPARLADLSGGRVDLVATGSGPVEVRVRWAAHWRVVSGEASLTEAPGGWTMVTAERPGPLTLRAGWR